MLHVLVRLPDGVVYSSDLPLLLCCAVAARGAVSGGTRAPATPADYLGARCHYSTPIPTVELESRVEAYNNKPQHILISGTIRPSKTIVNSYDVINLNPTI